MPNLDKSTLNQIAYAAGILAKAQHTIALTGAGISVESGIPPFRGKGGLWEKIDPMKYAHIDAYLRNPAEVWEVLFLSMRDVLQNATPNDGHKGLYRLEALGALQTIVTQNIDGLHQLAGSKDVIEFHGSFATQRCMGCARQVPSNEVSVETLPPLCQCGGMLRPDVVMFGELIPMDHLQRSQRLASTCDAMLVVGTSATVEPAAHLPIIAKHSGAAIIEINPEPTPLTRDISDVTLLGTGGEMMNALASAVEQLR